jgi:peptidoglycan L-alanyl-D-glutamate endopeptidase CwlK
MSNRYGEHSLKQMDKLHPVLKILFTAVLSRYDHTAIESHRGEKKQNEYFDAGASMVKFPDGMHNKSPSLALDAAPFIRNTYSTNTTECAVFGARVMIIAKELGIPIRWGGDWDGDDDLKEHKLKDYWHFELDIDLYKKNTWFQMYGL